MIAVILKNLPMELSIYEKHDATLRSFDEKQQSLVFVSSCKVSKRRITVQNRC